MSTILTPHVRSGTFIYSFSLGNDWLGSDFTGGIKWTLRKNAPASTVSTDSGPNVIAQATTAGGEITSSFGVVTITIPSSKTRKWPVGEWFWDVQATVSGSPDLVYKIDVGTIQILADYTRS